MQSYKNTAEAKTAAAATAEKNAKDVQTKYDELNKTTAKTYKGSPTYGSLTFNYPRSWSVYDGANSGEPLNLYFYPDVVPATDSNANYFLRVELLSSDYAQVLSQFSSSITDGSIKASAYLPPKMKSVANVQAGTKLDGDLSRGDGNNQPGSMVIMKLRDKTLQISTLSPDGIKDFNSLVLDSLTFVP